jgi:hypothetical protein
MTQPNDLSSAALPADAHFDSDSESSQEQEEEVPGDLKIVDLPEVPHVTGEEQEVEMARFRAKIYRFREEEWKERGVGKLKFLRDGNSKVTRIVMRADKTGKLLLNHNLTPKNGFCVL